MFMYVVFSACMYICRICMYIVEYAFLVPLEARRGSQSPWNWNYSRL